LITLNPNQNIKKKKGQIFTTKSNKLTTKFKNEKQKQKQKNQNFDTMLIDFKRSQSIQPP